MTDATAEQTTAATELTAADTAAATAATDAGFDMTADDFDFSTLAAPEMFRSGCYEDSHDQSSITGCSCHASCAACGYNDAPTGNEDCITCADAAHILTPVFDDGTGSCAAPAAPAAPPS